jgi:cytochrome bd-type quinol oxidase subunit 2
MKISEVWWFKELVEYYELPQESNELKSVGLYSTSSYENLFNFMILLIIVILIDIFVTVTAKVILRNTESVFVQRIKKFYYKTMRYAFYTRALLLVYQFMVLTSTDEIHENNLSSTSEVTSLALALFILVFSLLFTFYSFILIMSESTLCDKGQPFEELYLGN